MRMLGALRRAAICFAVALPALCVSVNPVSASIVRFLSVEELSQASSDVVRGRVVGQTVHWTPHHEGIYTKVQIEVLEALQGEASPGRRMTIIQAGGTIDGVSLDWTGRPVFTDGEDLILFLQPYEPGNPADGRHLVVGGKQGRMTVVSDPSGLMARRDLIGLSEAPFVEGAAPAHPPARRDLLPLDDLRQRLRRAPKGSTP